MSESQTSFSERLARIETKRAVHTPTGGGGGMPPSPPSGPKRPRGGGGGGGRGLRIAMSMAVSFLVIAGVAFVWLLMSSEQGHVNRMAAASEAEIAGKPTILTRLINNDSGADLSISLAVRTAEQRLASGTLTPDQERKTRAFIESNKGVSAADKVRETMSGMIKMSAEMAGQPALGDAAVRELDACSSTTCLAYVQAKFDADLRAATGG